MKNHHSPGSTLAMVAPQDLLSGDIVVVGDLTGVNFGDVVSGSTMQLNVEGVFTLPKDGTTIAAGGRVYATGTQGTATATVGTNKQLGFAVLAAAGGDSTVLVKLDR
jgi:predicted RecA/RadA family phage recombinase